MTIFASAKNPPMSELAMRECVWRNTQKTRANHIKKLVTEATSEFPNKVWKILRLLFVCIRRVGIKMNSLCMMTMNSIV